MTQSRTILSDHLDIKADVTPARSERQQRAASARTIHRKVRDLRHAGRRDRTACIHANHRTIERCPLESR
jgi:hypothetical protein